ncbi:type II toxin-antitoxin system RelE/ParE family toxin [Kribbella sp. NPDC056345]|uniref:type II toxin-antitoxin system RelE family toxin n=1 Tax=Kribbella sp. NPDC056345 TaxID=3345789 RepID=UPI0035D7F76F
MSQRNLTFQPAYLAGYKDLLATDRLMARRVRNAVNGLARDPEPPGSSHMGDSLFYRLHIDDYRVLYEVSDDTVRVWSLGRSPG